MVVGKTDKVSGIGKYIRGRWFEGCSFSWSGQERYFFRAYIWAAF